MPDSDQDLPAKATPNITFASALGEAGHEVAELGFEGVPDDGPLLEQAESGDASEDEMIDALDRAVGGLHDDPPDC
jgi:hypothetical protein